MCVHYHSLNNECVYDPFPISFSNEVFDNVGGNEAILLLMVSWGITMFTFQKRIRRPL